MHNKLLEQIQKGTALKKTPTKVQGRKEESSQSSSSSSSSTSQSPQRDASKDFMSALSAGMKNMQTKQAGAASASSATSTSNNLNTDEGKIAKTLDSINLKIKQIIKLEADILDLQNKAQEMEDINTRIKEVNGLKARAQHEYNAFNFEDAQRLLKECEMNGLKFKGFDGLIKDLKDVLVEYKSLAAIANESPVNLKVFDQQNTNQNISKAQANIKQCEKEIDGLFDALKVALNDKSKFPEKNYYVNNKKQELYKARTPFKAQTNKFDYEAKFFNPLNAIKNKYQTVVNKVEQLKQKGLELKVAPVAAKSSNSLSATSVGVELQERSQEEQSASINAAEDILVAPIVASSFAPPPPPKAGSAKKIKTSPAVKPDAGTSPSAVNVTPKTPRASSAFSLDELRNKSGQLSKASNRKLKDKPEEEERNSHLGGELLRRRQSMLEGRESDSWEDETKPVAAVAVAAVATPVVKHVFAAASSSSSSRASSSPASAANIATTPNHMVNLKPIAAAAVATPVVKPVFAAASSSSSSRFASSSSTSTVSSSTTTPNHMVNLKPIAVAAVAAVATPVVKPVFAAASSSSSSSASAFVSSSSPAVCSVIKAPQKNVDLSLTLQSISKFDLAILASSALSCATSNMVVQNYMPLAIAQVVIGLGIQGYLGNKVCKSGKKADYINFFTSTVAATAVACCLVSLLKNTKPEMVLAFNMGSALIGAIYASTKKDVNAR